MVADLRSRSTKQGHNAPSEVFGICGDSDRMLSLPNSNLLEVCHTMMFVVSYRVGQYTGI